MDLKSSNSRLIPGIGRIPFPAYRGNEPYIFVSYAHKNAEAVFTEINRWNKQGYNIWYDEGIAPGNEWEDEIAKALENCTLFVVFITPDSIESKNCRDEIYFALDSGLPIIAIHLVRTELKGGLKLRMSSIQAILKYSMNDEEYIYKYVTAFNEYGFKIPTILRNSEKTDNYKPLELNHENQMMLAELLLQHDHKTTDVKQSGLSDEARVIAENRALCIFMMAEAADSKIYPKDFTMGIKTSSSVDLDKGRLLYTEALKERGWTQGRFDPEKKTTNLEPLGYRTENIEFAMERDIRILQSCGYDLFRPISNEEKEALFKQIKAEIDNTGNSGKLENIKSRYSNFIEIVDMVNDAHIRLDKQ